MPARSSTVIGDRVKYYYKAGTIYIENTAIVIETIFHVSIRTPAAAINQLALLMRIYLRSIVLVMSPPVLPNKSKHSMSC